MGRELLRDAARSLRRDQRFTTVAAALLAVTLGTLTAVYSIVHAVILKPLPVADQDRLVVIWQRDDRRALPVVEVAYREMEDWRSRTRTFEDLAVVGSVNWNLTLVGQPDSQSVPIAAVSATFFTLLGASPAIGRTFEAADEHGDLPRGVVLSHGLWTRRFGGDPGIVGRAVQVKLDADSPAISVVVLGVMPAAFDFPRQTEIWVPAAPMIRKFGAAFGAAESLAALRVFYVVGRMVRGTTLDAATQEISHVMRTTDTKGGAQPNAQLVLTPLSTFLLGPAEPVLWALLGGAVLMLAIACANVAGLQVSRTWKRQRALAIRAALGASQTHLIMQTVLESALLSGAALAAGALVAFLAMRGLVLLAPAAVPRIEAVGLSDPRVLAFGGTVTFITVLACGLWPALVARRVDAARALAHGAGAPSDPGGRRLQRIVVTGQVAVALTLLTGAGLFVRTLQALDRTVLGFEPDRLLAVSVTPPTDDLDRWNAYYDALIARLAALSEIESVGAVALRPLSGPIGWDSQMLLPGQDPKQPSTWELNPHTNLEVVTPSYFDTMRTRVLRGRGFTATDTAKSPGVVVVSESTARRLWPGRDAVGQQLRDPTYRSDAPLGASNSWQTVIGVVEDIRYRGLTDVRLDLYLPATQSSNRVQQLVVRSRVNPADVVASVRSVARELNPKAGVSDVAIMTTIVAAESAPWRFLMRVFIAFATLAAVLASVGLVGVVALSVSTRRRELAIRAALGADRARLRYVVFREGATLVVFGAAAGVLASLALGRSAAHLLVGVPPHDPLALGGAAVAAAAIAILAIWLPTRRAADADPLEVLRSE
jgi:predicted permease